jgi:uncharacterized membrane protein
VSSRVALARGLSLASYLGLVGWMMAWIVWLGDTPRQQISFWLLVLVTPLLIPLRGVLAGRDRAIVWGTLVSLIYVVHGGMLAWVDGPQRAFGLLEAGLAALFVVSGSFFVRWRADAAASP